MKKLSIALLFSCLSIGTSYIKCESDSIEMMEAESRCSAHAESEAAKVDAGLTWEVINGSNCIYIELARTEATDETWEQICELVEQVIPESRARQIGAESNTLSCTVRRDGVEAAEWDVRLAAVVTRVKEVITVLQNSQLSGATVQVYITNLSE